MAATMAVATMVTRSKAGGGALTVDRKGWFVPELALPWSSAEGECEGKRVEFPRRAPPLFASVGLSISAGGAPAAKGRTDNCDVARQLEAEEAAAARKRQGKKRVGGGGLLSLRKVRVKIGNPHLRRLVSGAIAGAVSRTFVAPLETIRTHLMVGSCGAGSMAGVFRWIMRNEGWTGLFRGNGVNVLRVAPSKAIEHFTYDTAKKYLTPEDGEPAKIPIPTPLVAGALAGVASTLCTYPMELVKTRLTIEKDAYDNVLDAFVKIVREGGPSELYRGLAPSLIGVVPEGAAGLYRGLGPSCIKLMPAAGISFMCYEALKKVLVEEVPALEAGEEVPALEAGCVEDDEEEEKEKVA
uniref:Uncharacterized protein n=1 Tax=Oryza brachyantha TaxID=4533 RepID=J3LAP3_ORYBR